MPQLPDIKRVRTLQNVGIFHQYRHDGAVPEFKRFNLVYGFNGTGKTTISRILRGLDEGDAQSTVPPEGVFEIELSDGLIIRPAENADALQRRVLVFNEDFINENLRWSDGRVNPVFYIGKDASRRAELLERIELRIPMRDAQRRQAQTDHSTKERALATFHTNTARFIAEMLGRGRQYDARNLRQDYASDEAANYKALSDDEREDRKTLIRQAGSYDKLDLPELDTRALRSVLDQARRISETTISGLTLQEMQDHPSMVPWVKTGLDYHSAQDLETCLFCGNEILDSRVEALRNVLDESFGLFFAEIEDTVENVRKHWDALRSLPSALPDVRAVTASLSRNYTEAVGPLSISLGAIQETLDLVASAVVEKPKSLNRSNWPEGLADDESIDSAIDVLQKDFGEVLVLIEGHNREQDAFTQRQRQARNELKFAELIERNTERESLRDALAAAATEREIRERLHAKLVERASTLRTEIRDHGPAVSRINALMHAYLGHDEIRLDIFEEGYRIFRHDEAIAGPLSEGERTAIALCYFLSKLEEEGRSLNQQIVVVDDPVSSLDAGALNYAFNLLKGMLQDAQQLIIFTHNLPFMNEMKKWLRKSREQGKASFFYIRAWQPAGQNRRQAAIVEMPKLLRAYDSEYQYLFYLVKKCVDEGAESPEVPGYIMPNVIRRVLELFLAFKIPSSEGLGDKINRPLVQDAGLEQPRLHALNRLTQVESHSDSLDDFIGFSAMTIEETHRAAQAVLKLIELLDTDHYTRMCEIAN